MESKTKISTRNLNLYYGENHALKNINLDLYEHKITAFIGPSGCGKSTYLKTLKRMNDLVPGVKIDGTVLLDDEDIYDSHPAEKENRHGIPAAQPLSHEYL